MKNFESFLAQQFEDYMTYRQKLGYRPQEKFFGVKVIFFGTNFSKKCMKVVKTAFNWR